jgi:CrcB protein
VFCLEVMSRRSPCKTSEHLTAAPEVRAADGLPSTLPERRAQLQKYLWIAAGGAAGSIARYWIGSAVGSRMGIRFPYGTLIVNVTACLIIGFSLTYLGRRADLDPAWRFLIPIGFVGAYSTFSTYEWETLATLRSGAYWLAALYAVGSLILGLAATWAGAALGDVL